MKKINILLQFLQIEGTEDTEILDVHRITQLYLMCMWSSETMTRKQLVRDGKSGLQVTLTEDLSRGKELARFVQWNFLWVEENKDAINIQTLSTRVLHIYIDRQRRKSQKVSWCHWSYSWTTTILEMLYSFWAFASAGGRHTHCYTVANKSLLHCVDVTNALLKKQRWITVSGRSWCWKKWPCL